MIPEAGAPLAGLRIAHVVNSLELGGAERILVKLLPGLAAAGATVSLITLKGRKVLDGDLGAERIDVHNLGVEGLATAVRCVGLIRRLRGLRPHVVHTHLFIADSIGSVAARLAGCRFVVSTRHDTGAWMRARERVLERALFARFDRVVAVSNAAALALRRRGHPAQRILVLPHSTTSATDGRPPTFESRSADSGPIICTVGRLIPSKAVGDLLRAAKELRSRYPAAVYWIVGCGPEKASLVELCERLGMADRVTFLGSRRDALSLIARADVFVLPSHEEALSMVLIEAMACGKPIVAAASAGASELLASNDAALLVAPGDHAAIAAALARILEDPRLADELGSRARDSFSKTRTSEAMIAAHVAFYRDLLGIREALRK